MEAPVELVCAHCGGTFLKVAREYRRQVRRGHTEFYCGLSCVRKAANIKRPPKGNPKNLGAWLGNGRKVDDLSPFRWFLSRAVYRQSKKGATDLTPRYLKDVWDAQNGVCPLTGWAVRLPYGSMGWPGGSTPEAASLDRIDNSKGYVQGNVRFVALMANLARQCFSDSDVRRFAEAVYHHDQVSEVFGVRVLGHKPWSGGGRTGNR